MYSVFLSTVLVLLRCVHSYEHQYCVNAQSGSNSPACLEEDCSRPCLSLEYLVDSLHGPVHTGVKIVIEGPALEISAPVSFIGFQDVALVGNSSSVTVTCTPRNGEEMTDAGLTFVAIKNLSIADLTFERCGSLHNSTSANTTSGNSTLRFKSAIYVLNCTDVSIADVTVRNSCGTGLAFFDTNGTVIVSHSVFEANSASHPDPGGGGVYVEFSYCTPGTYGTCTHSPHDNQNSIYKFQCCNFTDNNASTLYPHKTSFVRAEGSDFQGLGRGGGLCIVFKGETAGTFIDIFHCEFIRNAAIWGGALFIQFQDSSSNNSVTITDSPFIENDCYVNGGGAADIGYIFYLKPTEGDKAVNNTMTFKNCKFVRNHAVKYGGGVALFASRGLHHTALSNNMIFEDCSWVENWALAGAAVDISPHVWDTFGNGLLPTPMFIDCSFESNYIRPNLEGSDSGVQPYLVGMGTFLVDTFNVQFTGNTNFTSNDGTALCLTSGVVEFSDGSDVLFLNNSGVRGGAVALVAYSVIYVNKNSRLQFVNNTALSKGGGIYTHSVDKHEYLSSRSCFIQYRGSESDIKKMNITRGSESDIKERNVTLVFSGNRAEVGDGHCIFADSLLPCRYACSVNGSEPPPVAQAFDCIGTIIGQKNDSGYNVTTVARNITVYDSAQDIIPGKVFTLPVAAYDELSQKKPGVVYQAIIKNGSSISIDSSFSHISNNKIQLYGPEESTGHLILEKVDVSVSLSIKLTKCPPGFTLDDGEGSGLACICAASTYYGIWKCDHSTTKAYISHGFWIGYCSSADKSSLCTAHCPLGFCSYNGTKTGPVHLLPARSSELDAFICGPTRTGVLCGKCRGNYSVYFHCHTYKCGPDHLCNIGWLFYIMSELLPLTVLFLLIMFFNIRFTSGTMNGFILFAQVLDSLSIDSNGAIQFPPAIEFLTTCHRFIYRLFNLDFFSTDRLSFCLWKGATVLDAMAMKYVTIIYALGLVFCTVLALNTWRCRRFFSFLKRRTLKGAVIHGLSAFFVMCYSQCTRVSFQILSSIYLYQGNNFYQKVVFRSGELQPFHGEHLKYAIPAIVFHLTLVMVPPILLLVYPLLCKLLGVCSLSESQVANKLTKYIPLQLLDSFQGCFQDNLRLFAGLYFLYRMFALAAYAFATSFSQFYTFVELELILILMLHAVAQPYKKRWHNIVDTLIFSDLAIINGLTLFNYVKVTTGKEEKESIESVIATTSSIQLILILLPLVYMVIYATVKAVNKLKIWRKERNKGSEPEVLTDSGSLPPLRDSCEETLNSGSFASPGDQHHYHRLEDSLG